MRVHARIHWQAFAPTPDCGDVERMGAVVEADAIVTDAGGENSGGSMCCKRFTTPSPVEAKWVEGNLEVADFLERETGIEPATFSLGS
jgi:hypothetical protein